MGVSDMKKILMWLLDVLLEYIGLERVSKQKERKEAIERKAEQTGQHIQHEVQLEQEEFNEEWREAVQKNDTKAQYEALKRDFNSDD